MAYLRREVETVETDFPQDKVWAALLKAAETLQWTVEESDQPKGKMKIKTRPNFMAYASLMVVDLQSAKENTTRIKVAAETPVTTLTGIVDFGRTRERIDNLLMALMAQLAPPKPPEDEETKEQEPSQADKTKPEK